MNGSAAENFEHCQTMLVAGVQIFMDEPSERYEELVHGLLTAYRETWIKAQAAKGPLALAIEGDDDVLELDASMEIIEPQLQDSIATVPNGYASPPEPKAAGGRAFWRQACVFVFGYVPAFVLAFGAVRFGGAIGGGIGILVAMGWSSLMRRLYRGGCRLRDPVLSRCSRVPQKSVGHLQFARASNALSYRPDIHALNFPITRFNRLGLDFIDRGRSIPSPRELIGNAPLLERRSRREETTR